MQQNAHCRTHSDCASHCCASDFLICVKSDICEIMVAPLKAFPVLEVVGAIGGLVFFIFLVVAICSKSSKNWDEVMQKNDINNTDPGDESGLTKDMSFHEREKVIKIQEERKRRKTIVLEQKKQRMLSIMREKDHTESFFKKKERRAEEIKKESFMIREKRKLKKESKQNIFYPKQLETEPKKKSSTRDRMRQLMKERMAKVFTQKISENTQENQLQSVENAEMIKVPYQSTFPRRISKSLRRYHLEEQLQFK